MEDNENRITELVISWKRMLIFLSVLVLPMYGLSVWFLYLRDSWNLILAMTFLYGGLASLFCYRFYRAGGSIKIPVNDNKIDMKAGREQMLGSNLSVCLWIIVITVLTVGVIAIDII